MALGKSQEPCSSRQADEALSSVPTACGRSGNDSLEIVLEVKVELEEKSTNLFRWSRKGPPNPLQVMTEMGEFMCSLKK